MDWNYLIRHVGLITAMLKIKLPFIQLEWFKTCNILPKYNTSNRKTSGNHFNLHNVKDSVKTNRYFIPVRS